MKKILLFTAFYFLCTNYFSQLEIKESNEGITIGSYSAIGQTYVKCTNYNGSYAFTFRDGTYSTLDEYKTFWIRGNESFNQLYNVICETLDKKENKKLDINLDGENSLKLNFTKRSVTFWLWDGYNWSYSASCSKKQIDKIFGKSE